MTMSRRSKACSSSSSFSWFLFVVVLGTITNTASSIRLILGNHKQDISTVDNNNNNNNNGDDTLLRKLVDESHVAPSFRNLEKVPMNDIDNFFKTGEAPEGEEESWPLSYTATITIDVLPLPRMIDSAETKLMISALKYFYKTMFSAQDTYDIHIRRLSIEDQQVVDTDIVSFQTMFAINFLPMDDDQTLSNEELKTVLVHLMNKFDEYIIFYLKHQGPVFEEVSSVSASFEETIVNNKTENNGWIQGDMGAILAIVLSVLVMTLSVAGSYVLYRNETIGRLKVRSRFKKHTNISPFRESHVDAPTTPVIGYGMGIGSKNEESVSFVSKNRQPSLYHAETSQQKQSPHSRSNKSSPYTAESTKDFSFPGGDTDDILPQSPNSHMSNDPFLSDIRLSRSPRDPNNDNDDDEEDGTHRRHKRSVEIDFDPEIASDLLDIDDPRVVASRKTKARERATVTSTAFGKVAETVASKLSLPMDPTTENNDTPLEMQRPKPKEQRRECFAPAGKLGVAIDSVNGIPVVHRLKDGSPLEGTLKHMDQIVAINDVDTTGMSAADVTHLILKGMGQERKISYIRTIEASDVEIC